MVLRMLGARDDPNVVVAGQPCLGSHLTSTQSDRVVFSGTPRRRLDAPPEA
jgi:hypothetical protein